MKKKAVQLQARKTKTKTIQSGDNSLLNPFTSHIVLISIVITTYYTVTALNDPLLITLLNEIYHKLNTIKDN